MENEIWKAVGIAGFEPFYLVSNSAKVKSLGCEFVRSDRRIYRRFPRILKPLMILGYEHVFLRNNSIVSQQKIHRLVAMAFIPNPENKPFINHIDGNKVNNSIENLEWCTHSENMQHSFYVLKNKANENKEIIQKTISGIEIKRWPSLHAIEKETGFSRRNIQANITGKYKYAYNSTWEYV